MVLLMILSSLSTMKKHYIMIGLFIPSIGHGYSLCFLEQISGNKTSRCWMPTDALGLTDSLWEQQPLWQRCQIARASFPGKDSCYCMRQAW